MSGIRTRTVQAAQHAPIRPGSRPLRLLEILAREDLTLNEAAQRLHISVSTANQHIAAVRKALGAQTTVYATARAIKLGLITL